MKVRKDFVTNSSSSSFIISKDNISRDKLLEVLFEIANKEAEHHGGEKYIWDEDVKNDVVAYKYNILEATPEDPYDFCYDYCFTTVSKEYSNHFIIDNDCCSRYNWGIITEILSKYNIPWEYGPCD